MANTHNHTSWKEGGVPATVMIPKSPVPNCLFFLCLSVVFLSITLLVFVCVAVVLTSPQQWLLPSLRLPVESPVLTRSVFIGDWAGYLRLEQTFSFH